MNHPDQHVTTNRATGRHLHRRLGGAAAVALTIAAAGCGPAGGHEGAETAPAPAARALSVTAVSAGDRPAHFEAGGVIRARSTAAVSARVMAPVVSVTVRAGDVVKRGTTLVTLDAREMTALAARGRASAVAAEEAVHAAEAQAEAADAMLRLARATHDRMKGLYDKRSATAHELDQAVAGQRAAEAQVAAARSQQAAAAAARDAARAGAEAADIGLSYTTITAPFDGVVATRSVDPGTLAAPGVPLVVLEQAGAVRLEATLDEARAGGVAVGQAVDVRLDGSGPWRPAAVAEIGRLDSATHSFLVKIDLPVGTSARTGSFGRARFSGTSRRALTVPASSLVRRGQLAFVFVVGPDRLARLRPVTPGPAAGDEVEILAGLTERDSVVTVPPADLRDGTPVSSTAADAASRGDVR